MNIEQQQIITPPEPTALDYIKEINELWIAGIVPIVLAWFVWRAKSRGKK